MKSDGKGGVVCWSSWSSSRIYWKPCSQGETLTFDPQTKRITSSDKNGITHWLIHAPYNPGKESKELFLIHEVLAPVMVVRFDPTMAQWQENKDGSLTTLHDPAQCVYTDKTGGGKYGNLGLFDCASVPKESFGTQYNPPPGMSDAVLAAAGAPRMTPPAPSTTSTPTNAPTNALTNAPTDAPKAKKNVSSGGTPSGSGATKGSPAGGGTKKSPGLKGVKNTVKPTQAYPKSTAKMSGDPHIVQWSGNKFDFHGACDLVFIYNPAFANGLGLHVHVRTKGEKWWSFIQTAVLKIGDDTLEVAGGENGGNYWLNGVAEEELKEEGALHLSLFQVTHHRSSDKQRKFRIDLGNGAIAFETYKNFVSVIAKAKDPNCFQDAVGLMGLYPTGVMVGRDGITLLEDPIAFGLEWQVLSSEPMLFHDLGEGVHHPEVCTLPSLDASAQDRRRLGESSTMTEEDAKVACARVDELDRDACIFDVLATNDKGMAGVY